MVLPSEEAVGVPEEAQVASLKEGQVASLQAAQVASLWEVPAAPPLEVTVAHIGHYWMTEALNKIAMVVLLVVALSVVVLLPVGLPLPSIASGLLALAPSGNPYGLLEEIACLVSAAQIDDPIE